MVNVGTAITKAMTKIAGSNPRTSFVTWFNEIARDILTQPRTWKFLDDPVTLTLVSNQITIPAYISEISSISIGDNFYTKENQITEKEAHEITLYGSTIVGNISQGYILNSDNVITFYPTSTETTADIIGELSMMADYVDNDDTIFPDEFENLFIIGLRTQFYDRDTDGRFSKESTLYQIEMYKMKAWDNRRKVLPRYNPRGYTRN